MRRAVRVTLGGAIALAMTSIGGPATADDRGILEQDVPVEMSAGPESFFPVYDGYRDFYNVQLFESPATDEWMREIEFEILSPGGDVVVAEEGDTFRFGVDGEISFSWNAHRSSGRVFHEGTYTIRATVVDRSNDRKVMTEAFKLDHASVQWVRWRRTFRAADTIIDRDVGRCAALRRPARAGWPGSLGYRSRCRDGRRSVVSTVHEVTFPEPFRGWFSHVRLSMYGGHAKGSARSRLQYFYLTHAGEWKHTLRGFRSDLGTHAGFIGTGSQYVHGRRNDDPPHFIWSAGLGGGQAYDVKTFTVTTQYQVLK